MKKLFSILVTMVLFFCFQGIYAQTNLLDTSTWTVGNGSVVGTPDFNQYGYTSSNIREMGQGPHSGSDVVLWKIVPSSQTSQEGGWTTDEINIDHTKTYRFTTWVKKTGSTSGTLLFGFYCDNNGSSSEGQTLNGTTNSNPYFLWDDTNEVGADGLWYLLVGYIHESGTSQSTSLGGIYDLNGTKLYGLNDFKFSTSAVRVRHRNYLYNTNNTAVAQYFFGPTIYEVNGQEPTIQELINGPNASDTQAPTAPTLSSTGQSTTTVNLSWVGATDDTAVTGYKIFKDGVLEATLGNVSTYTVTGLAASTGYAFTVTALDAASNESTVSNSVSSTTSSSGGGSGNWILSGSDINYTAGNVGIGTTAQTAYRLAVDGKIHTKEVKVDLSGWADYVFTKEYTLPTLEEVEKHINEKGHLINMPSAEEVEVNGIELGAMNKLLLEKIEELTLYILRQEKEIQVCKSLEFRISELENKN